MNVTYYNRPHVLFMMLKCSSGNIFKIEAKVQTIKIWCQGVIQHVRRVTVTSVLIVSSCMIIRFKFWLTVPTCNAKPWFNLIWQLSFSMLFSIFTRSLEQILIWQAKDLTNCLPLERAEAVVHSQSAVLTQTHTGILIYASQKIDMHFCWDDFAHKELHKWIL